MYSVTQEKWHLTTRQTENFEPIMMEDVLKKYIRNTHRLKMTKIVAEWSMVKTTRTDMMTVEMWDCFLSLTESCVHTS